MWVCSLVSLLRLNPWTLTFSDSCCPGYSRLGDDMCLSQNTSPLSTAHHIPGSTDLGSGPLDHVNINPPKHSLWPIKLLCRMVRPRSEAVKPAPFLSQSLVLASSESPWEKHTWLEVMEVPGHLGLESVVGRLNLSRLADPTQLCLNLSCVSLSNQLHVSDF